jgi:hypothetical protein
MKMASVGDVKEKVQRILSNALGSVRIDKDGDFVITYNSSITYVEVEKFGKESVRVTFRTPLVRNVEITPEVYKWVATEGQTYWFGSCRVFLPEGKTTGMVVMEHTILADDLDESELVNAMAMMSIAGDEVDNKIRDLFGGELCGNEEY